MKYLITGGAGFIGSHLTDFLVKQGHEVHIVDDLSTGRFDNIAHHANNEAVTFVRGSILDIALLQKEVEWCDQIFHLAAVVGVRLILERPVHTIETNVDGAQNVLKLASAYGKKVLIASTSEVYGKAMETSAPIDRLKEDGDWTLGSTGKSRWAYACSKAMDEFLALAYHEERGLPVVVARFFNTVGPRQTAQYGMVIPNFVESAIAGEPIHVFGDGEQTRCFTAVADAVRGACNLMECDTAAGQVFNIGSDGEISMNQLAHRVKELSNSTSQIVHVPYEEAYGPGFEDMRRRTPDISKLRDLIDYRPTYTTDDILKEVIQYTRQRSGKVVRPERAVA